jgi:tetratricopeptide (TPR) repeat protein
MPSKRFMVVHERRDHSLRVPQPSLTEAIGALAAIASDASRPAIVRATALELLGGDTRAETAAFAAALAAPQPLLRYTAVSRFPSTEAAHLADAIAPLLVDPIRAVRIAAATRCTELPPAQRDALPRAAFEIALGETVESLRYMSDLPSGPFHLGNVYANIGRTDDAEREYRRAIAIDDRFPPAKVSLAQLAAAHQRAEEAEAVLRTVRTDDLGFAEAALDLGLLLAEQGKLDAAEAALRDSLAADPTRPSTLYNLAALIVKQHPGDAISMFRRAAELDPDEPRYASSLAYALAQSGDLAGAATTLEALVVSHPSFEDAYPTLGAIYERQHRIGVARALYLEVQNKPTLSTQLKARLADRAQQLRR